MTLDPQAYYQNLLLQIKQALNGQPPDASPPVLVGIISGGEILARRLAQDLTQQQQVVEFGCLDISFYRDDLGVRRFRPSAQQTKLPNLQDRWVIAIDDVLFTGRTVRAAINHIFDYGRPARIDLGVLLDRGGRELPVEARFVGYRLDLPLQQSLVLEETNGMLALSLQGAK